jgi:hypothetical protein
MIKANVFDFVNSINYTKINLLDGSHDYSEEDYIPYIVNRSESYFQDSIYYAGDMNQYPNLPKKLQYDYLRYSLRARKRFSKWPKPIVNDDLVAIQSILSLNICESKDLYPLLSKEELEEIKTAYELRKKSE